MKFKRIRNMITGKNKLMEACELMIKYIHLNASESQCFVPMSVISEYMTDYDFSIQDITDMLNKFEEVAEVEYNIDECFGGGEEFDIILYDNFTLAGRCDSEIEREVLESNISDEMLESFMILTFNTNEKFKEVFFNRIDNILNENPRVLSYTSTDVIMAIEFLKLISFY